MLGHCGFRSGILWGGVWPREGRNGQSLAVLAIPVANLELTRGVPACAGGGKPGSASRDGAWGQGGQAGLLLIVVLPGFWDDHPGKHPVPFLQFT